MNSEQPSVMTATAMREALRWNGSALRNQGSSNCSWGVDGYGQRMMVSDYYTKEVPALDSDHYTQINCISYVS